MTLADFNALPAESVRPLLLECCGSGRWAEAMLAMRAVSSLDILAQAADQIWWSLDSSDWLQAFDSHPRIGESGRLSAWSRQEQGGVLQTGEIVKALFAARNLEYEGKFGWIFITCASGKTAEEMLHELEKRLLRDKDSELITAATEQTKIMQLRLRKALAT